MLQETQNLSSGFGIGQTVIINETKQTGSISRFENGKWVIVLDNGGEAVKEGHEISPRQKLFG